MKILFCICSGIIFCFPLFLRPVSIIASLLTVSLFFVSLLSFFGSFWFSYTLFLVYVGGLLVLFIYVCLVSSNTSMSLNMSLFGYVFLFSRLMSAISFFLPKEFLGQRRFDRGFTLVDERSLSLFLFLVVLLLVILLVVVRVSGIGMAVERNEV